MEILNSYEHQVDHDSFLQKLGEFSQQLTELESKIPQMSDELCEPYKKHVTALETTLEELRDIKSKISTTPDHAKLESYGNQLFTELEERLKIAKESILQEKSNKNIEESCSERKQSQPSIEPENKSNSYSFFKKAAIVAGMSLVAVSVYKILSS